MAVLDRVEPFRGPLRRIVIKCADLEAEILKRLGERTGEPAGRQLAIEREDSDGARGHLRGRHSWRLPEAPNQQVGDEAQRLRILSNQLRESRF